MRIRKLLSWLLAVAALGLGVSLVMAWNATTITEATDEAAASRFADVRSGFADQEPLLDRLPSGQIVRRLRPPSPAELSHLFVLAYDAAIDRLVEVDVPFWFFRMKAPAAQFLVRGTGLDLNELGMSAADLEAQGPALLLDESSADGSRLMVWTR